MTGKAGRLHYVKLFLASGFGLGLLPVVPGSFGALCGGAWHGIAWLFAFPRWITWIWCLAGVLFFAALHYALTKWAQDYWGESDPKHFVLDEVVGYLCVPVFAFLPDSAMVNGRWPWWYMVTGFIVFRIFDAIKLPGARYIDRNIHNAHGVLFDDVVSAAYAAAMLMAIAWLVEK